jgi:hypothetical protein
MHGVLLTDTPAAATEPTQWAAIVGGILLLIYITCIRPMRNKAKRDPLARQPAQTLLSQQRAVERDMTALLVEYEQMIRRMTAQVETRVTKLELLLEEADRKLDALRSATADTPVPDAPPGVAATATTDDSHPPRQRTPSEAAPQEGTPHPDAIPMTSPRLRTTSATPMEKPPAPAVEPPSRELLIAPPPSPHAPLYELADRGLTAGQIARRLALAHGEVELILALRPGRPDDRQSSDRLPSGGSGSAAHDPPPQAVADEEPDEPRVAGRSSGIDRDSPDAGEADGDTAAVRRRREPVADTTDVALARVPADAHSADAHPADPHLAAVQYRDPGARRPRA